MIVNSEIQNRTAINILLISFLITPFLAINAQSDKKYIRQGNKEYEKNNFSDSEVAYRKASDKNQQSPDAIFNIGDALYKQKKYEDASKSFVQNINMNDDNVKKSSGLYNLGNTLLMADKVKESIEAYKGSLKLNPDNIQAKYNLAYAQDLLKQQEQQQQQDKQDNQDNKENNKDENKDDQNNTDKQDQQKEQQSGQDKQQQEQQQQTISKEDAQRLLNALANDEKDVQEKVKLAKAAKARVKSVKNW